MTNFSKRVTPQFGKLKGLLRAHFAFSELLQEFVNGWPTCVAAHIALLLQSLHQVALGGRVWSHANLLPPTPDPLGRSELGGGPEEMASIAKHRRATKEHQRHYDRSEPNNDQPASAEAAKRSRGTKK